MKSPAEPRLQHRRCDATLALARTVHAMRQHEGTPRLRDEVRNRGAQKLADLLAGTDLVLRLQDGEALCHEHAVLSYGPSSVPFGLLAEEGIGEVVLEQGTRLADVARLLDLLAGASAPSDDHDLAGEIDRAGLRGVHLHAPSGEPPARLPADEGTAWWLFPAPRTDPSALRLVERELAANLPHQVSRLLLADLDATGDPATGSAGRLAALLAAMLAGGDPASAGWLLERAGHSPGVPEREARALRAQAGSTFAGGWLANQLDRDDTTPGLVALALELGGECVERLCTAAAATDTPLPEWVTSLLPPAD